MSASRLIRDLAIRRAFADLEAAGVLRFLNVFVQGDGVRRYVFLYRCGCRRGPWQRLVMTGEQVRAEFVLGSGWF